MKNSVMRVRRVFLGHQSLAAAGQKKEPAPGSIPEAGSSGYLTGSLRLYWIPLVCPDTSEGAGLISRANVEHKNDE
jgi:hypothetical protein